MNDIKGVNQCNDPNVEQILVFKLQFNTGLLIQKLPRM